MVSRYNHWLLFNMAPLNPHIPAVKENQEELNKPMKAYQADTGFVQMFTSAFSVTKTWIIRMTFSGAVGVCGVGCPRLALASTRFVPPPSILPSFPRPGNTSLNINAVSVSRRPPALNPEVRQMAHQWHRKPAVASTPGRLPVCPSIWSVWSACWLTSDTQMR